MEAVLFSLTLISLFFLNGHCALASGLLFCLVLTLRAGRRAMPGASGFSAVFILSLCSVLLQTTASCGFAREDIRAVYVRVEQDSVSGLWSSRRLTASLLECFSHSAEASSARGMINVTYPEGSSLYAGDLVLFYGSFNSYGFASTGYRIVARGSGNSARRSLLEKLTEALTEEGGEEAELSLMLILGIGGTGQSPLVELARKSGTSHVLALSGMHLSLFSMILKLVFSPVLGSRRARLLSLGLIAVYVFLIGPKPSILRAFILSSVFFSAPSLRPEQALYITFLIQSLIFPHTVSSLASVYSYLSLAGIMWLSPLLQEHLDRLVLLPRPAAVSLCSSAAAILFSSPLSWLVFGSYQLSALIFSSPVSLLVCLYMIISLVPPASLLKTPVLALIKFLMRLGAAFPEAETPLAWLVLLSIVLLVIAISSKLASCGR